MKKTKKIWIAVLVPIIWIGLLYSGVFGSKMVASAITWIPGPITSLQDDYPTNYYNPTKMDPDDADLRALDNGAPGTWLMTTFTLEGGDGSISKLYYFVPGKAPIQSKSVPVSAPVPTAKEIAEAKAVETYGNVQKNFEKRLDALKALKEEASKKNASAETKKEAKQAIELNLQDWHSVDAGFMGKIAESDSDVIIECVYEGKNYRFVIPAGGAKMIEVLDWYGPLCMQDLYGNSYVEE